LNSTTTGITEENKDVLNANRALRSGDSIDLAMYPYSLYNPYSSSNQSFAESSLKDTYTYTYMTDKNNTFKVAHKIRYYYYDGGYKPGKELLSNASNEESVDSAYKDTIYKDVTNLYTMKDSGNNTVYVNGEYTYYTASGEKKSVSYSKLFTAFDSYKENYIVDVSKLDGDDDSKEALKIKYVFRVEGVKIYERDSLYVLDESTGKINKIYPIVNRSNNIEDYINNRYLTNKEHGLYTVFRYKIDGKIQDFNYKTGESMWKVNNYNEDGTISDPTYYYALPQRSQQRIPNNITTNLVESCKVTLGGGYNLKHTGAAEVKSGSITVA